MPRGYVALALALYLTPSAHAPSHSQRFLPNVSSRTSYYPCPRFYPSRFLFHAYSSYIYGWVSEGSRAISGQCTFDDSK